jgi:hypothetical protein
MSHRSGIGGSGEFVLGRLAFGAAVALALASVMGCSGSTEQGLAIEEAHHALLVSDVWTMENASRWTVRPDVPARPMEIFVTMPWHAPQATPA